MAISCVGRYGPIWGSATTSVPQNRKGLDDILATHASTRAGILRARALNEATVVAAKTERCGPRQIMVVFRKDSVCKFPLLCNLRGPRRYRKISDFSTSSTTRTAHTDQTGPVAIVPGNGAGKPVTVRQFAGGLLLLVLPNTPLPTQNVPLRVHMTRSSPRGPRRSNLFENIFFLFPLM